MSEPETPRPSGWAWWLAKAVAALVFVFLWYGVGLALGTMIGGFVDPSHTKIYGFAPSEWGFGVGGGAGILAALLVVYLRPMWIEHWPKPLAVLAVAWASMFGLGYAGFYVGMIADRDRVGYGPGPGVLLFTGIGALAGLITPFLIVYVLWAKPTQRTTALIGRPRTPP